MKKIINKTKTSEVEWNIEKHFGVLSLGTNGWKTEINLVSWNGNPAKFDIRAWNEDHTKMGKGATLTGAEMKNLKEILNGNPQNVKLEEPPIAPNDGIPTVYVEKVV